MTDRKKNTTLDAAKLKADFPIFKRKIKGFDLVYLDNASTTQKPQSVIDAITGFYTNHNANIHRGVHTLAEEATDLYEATRMAVAKFIGAYTEDNNAHSAGASCVEIIFTKSTTEAINLVTYTYGEENVNEGDIVVVSALEHHSNLVPWQELCKRKKAILRILPIDEKGMLREAEFEKMITKGVKIVAVTQISNAIGTITPLEKIIKIAHDVGSIVLVDGAQGIAHLGVDVKKLDVDFYAFSAHKMCGPFGVGVLYGKKNLLETMRPFLYGGDMIKSVRPYDASYNDLPYKFEAGTPNIEGVVAFKAAIDYVKKTGLKNIREHEIKLAKKLREELEKLNGVTVYGSSDKKDLTGIVSFNIEGVHPHDVGTILDSFGVAIRAGHHCAEPLMQRLKIPATCRASFYFYNDESDIDALLKGLKKVFNVFWK